MKKVIVAYVPVLQSGYIKLFEAHPDAETIYILDEDVLAELDYLRKDIRAVKPKQMHKMLSGLNLAKKVELLSKTGLRELSTADVLIVVPQDDFLDVIKKHAPGATVEPYPVFLRWDRRNINKQDPVNPDHRISQRDFDRKVMRRAAKESVKASNLWRRVGAAIVKNGKVISLSANRQQPTDYSVYIDGDPRGIGNRGSEVEITTDMHAEALLIARAAKNGTKLEGASLYVTNFPCPPCAKLICQAGFKKCYYSDGYAMLDGETLMRSHNIELIRVEEPEYDGHPATWVKYPKKSS